MANFKAFKQGDLPEILNYIEREYSRVSLLPSTQTNNTIMESLSKMAVILFCGWLEDGLDRLYFQSIDRMASFRHKPRQVELIKKIYGFSKDNLLQGMLYSYGPAGLKYIEDSVGPSDLLIVDNILDNMKVWRDDSAHSYLKTISCSPTQTKSEYKKILPILKEIERLARIYRTSNMKNLT